MSMSAAQTDGLEAELDRLHAVGVTGADIRPDNIQSASPGDRVQLRHFQGVTLHASRSTAFFMARDRDRVTFNRLYNRDILTEHSARRALGMAISRANAEAPASDWYGAIDFGHGLTVGQVWSTDTGTGRWDYLNAAVITPLVAGMRVLDLGSNNGVQPLLMLRAGARQVVGLESSEQHVAAALVVHRLFEWRDLRSYQFVLHQRDMLAVLTDELGEFDVVSALCSLYYLKADDMARVVRRVAEIAPVMVLQGNTETPPSGAVQVKTGQSRSSVEFLQNVLRRNGFSDVEIHAPRRFSRPLLVGRA
jgi:SAM-dependent methyltransferase